MQLSVPRGLAVPDVTYDWRQTKGPQIDLNNSKSKQPEFTPDKSGIYQFEAILKQGTVIIAVVLLNLEILKDPPKIILIQS